MNQIPTVHAGEIAARIEPVPFSEIRGLSTLFLDFQVDSQLIDNYYPEKHKPAKEYAEEVLSNYTVDRESLCDALLATNKELGAKIRTFINIEMLRRKDCVAVVTGGHAGLFSGAVDSVYKVLSAVKAARELGQQNIAAVPVFWIFEEEHDFESVNSTHVIDKEGRLREIQHKPAAYTENLPVGFVDFDAAIEETIDELFSELPTTEFSGDLRELISGCYRSGETFSTAFGKLLIKLFGSRGLILLSPMKKRIKQLSAPIVTKAVESSGEIVARLQHIGRILKGENYHVEIPVEEDAFPFFLQNEGGERRTLQKDLETGRIKVQNSAAEFERSELVRIARTKPQFLSQNALIRPVVQDFLLPTLVYIGDSAEIACFAQNAVVYEILNRPVTPIRRASSFTVISGGPDHLIGNYRLKFQDLLAGKEHFLSLSTDGSSGDETARVLFEVEELILTQLGRLQRNLVETDPNLAGVVERRKQRILSELSMLRNDYLSAGSSTEANSRRQLENIFDSLFPNNGLQENYLNVVSFLNLYGLNFLELLYDAVSTHENRHQVMYI